MLLAEPTGISGLGRIETGCCPLPGARFCNLAASIYEEMEKGVHGWLVNISQWNPSEDDFFFYLSVLPSHEQSAITRFIKLEDRKRALVSRLLQYALAHEVLGIPFTEIVIKRTIEGKPFLEIDATNFKLPNFNFNVSHHGDYVAIASELMYLVGVDVVSYVIPERETALEFVGTFSSYLTSFELGNIIKAGTSEEILKEFYRYWCLKESFVKAIGAGFGFSLDRLEFHHTNWTDIYCHIDGEESKEWRFWLFELEKGHCVSIARGHPRFAVKDYKRTLQFIEFEESEYNSDFHIPPSFVPRTMEQLLPAPMRLSYCTLFSDKNSR